MLFTPDGRAVIATDSSPGMDRSIRVWDAKSGKLVRAFGTDGGFGFLALSSDGNTLAAEWGHNNIHFFDSRTGKQLNSTKLSNEMQGVVSALAFVSGDKELVSVGNQSLVQFWDIRTAKPLRQFECDARAFAVAISPDGQTIITGEGPNGDVVVRDAKKGSQRCRLEKAACGQNSLALAPDGKMLATGGEDGIIRLWSMSKPLSSRSLTGHRGEVKAVAFSRDGKMLATGGEDNTVRLWDVSSCKMLRLLQGHNDVVTSVSFSPDGKALASGSYDGTVRIWDTETGREKPSRIGHQGLINDMALSIDGKRLATSGADRTLRLWDLSSGREERRIAVSGGVYGQIAFSAGGNLLAADLKSGNIKVYDSTTGKPRFSFPGHGSEIMLMVPSHSGKAVATADDDDICVWRTENWKEVWHKRIGKEMRPSSIAFSPNGKVLAVAVAIGSGRTTQGEIRLLDASTGNEVQRLKRPKGDAISTFAFSPDSNYIAAGYGYDQSITIWDLTTNREKCQLSEPRHVITYLVYSPDGRFLASAALSESIVLWEVASGKKVRRFESGEDGVGKVTYTPDGRHLISKGLLTVLEWDVTGLDDFAVAKSIGDQDLNYLWNVLEGDDAMLSYKTMWRLSAATEMAVPFLGDKIKMVPEASSKVVARWISELDDDHFTVRQNATKELSRQGGAVLPDLHKALKAKPSAEARRSLEELVRSEEVPFAVGERLRELRTLAILEYAATPEAVKFLETLAKGTPKARLTRDAKASLERLKNRPMKR